MFNLDKLVRDNVKSLIPYSCARDEFSGSEAVFLDANENPFGKLNRYPDPYQKDLKKAVSRLKGVSEDRIFLGNGSDEIIDLCFRTFCNPGIDKVMVFTPTYGMYEVSAAINNIRVEKVPLDERFQIRIDDARRKFEDRNIKIIFICSPNNPTGNCFDTKVVEEIISGFDGIVVIDEAYNDFSDQPSYKERIDEYPNLVVMQTFSKSMGLAAARVGMCFTSTEIVSYFNKMKPPYNISTINQRAVLQKIGREKSYNEQVTLIKSERKRLAEEFSRLPVIKEIFPSEANFLLVRVTNAVEMYDFLVVQGIVVRNRTSVVNNCLRITVGTKTENNKLVRALKSFSK